MRHHFPLWKFSLPHFPPQDAPHDFVIHLTGLFQLKQILIGLRRREDDWHNFSLHQHLPAEACVVAPRLLLEAAPAGSLILEITANLHKLHLQLWQNDYSRFFCTYPSKNAFNIIYWIVLYKIRFNFKSDDHKSTISTGQPVISKKMEVSAMIYAGCVRSLLLAPSTHLTVWCSAS